MSSCNFGSWVFEYQLVSRLADPSPFPAPYSSSPTWIDSKKRNLNLNISSHKYAIGDTQLTVHSCYWGFCRKKEENILIYATISKDYLSNGNQNKIERWKNQIKSKDEWIRGSSFFFSFSCSLEFKVSLLSKIGSSNLWCLVLKLTFSLLSLKSWGQV